MDAVIDKRGSGGGDEESRAPGREELVPASGVGGERVDGAGVQRNLA